MPQPSHRSVVHPFLPFVVLLSVPVGLHAGSPEVAFDLAPTISCRDVTSPEFVTSHPGKRMVEATLLVSVRVRSGDANAVEEVSVEFSTDSDDFQVIDFSPQTELVSSIDGQIEQTTTTEQAHSLSATLGGAIPVPYGELVAQVAPSAKASTSKQRVTTESSKRLPPMNAVVVSGTTTRGRGVFFQFRRTARHTLEGTHRLTVQCMVPDEWRIGRGQLACRATGHERVFWIRKERTWTKATLPIILYEEGDVRAREVAEHAISTSKKHAAEGAS